MAQSLEEVIAEPGFANRINALIGRIPSLEHASEVTEVVGEAAKVMGCNGAVFTSFMREDDSVESYRYNVACAQHWCNVYSAQRWSAIDPYLTYAQIHNEPIAGDDIPLRNEQEHEFRRQADEIGFKSIAIVPSHTAGGRSRMGVLYMTSADPLYFTKASIPNAKMFLRSVASEVLDWWTCKIRDELLRKVQLREDEIELLRLTRQGLSSKEIARLCSVRPGTIDTRLARISMRFNAPNRWIAAKMAYEHGLLEG